MHKSIVIVSAADEKYFWLLRGLVQSLHDHGWAQKADISVIDLGMSAEQLRELTPLIASRMEGRWDIDFPGRATMPRWFQALALRPRLPIHFPGYDIYLWIDADAWIADGRAMELLVTTASEDGFALVPEIHAAYQWFYSSPEWSPRQTVYRCYAEGWGETAARRFSTMPVLNAGVLALRRDDPCWERWAIRLQEGLAKSNHLLVEQCALNLTVYADNVRCNFLPAWCNWVCHQAMPRYNHVLKRFEEPLRPYVPISIVHAANDRRLKFKAANRNGAEVEAFFNYMELKRAQII
jgi:hypothetical protein